MLPIDSERNHELTNSIFKGEIVTLSHAAVMHAVILRSPRGAIDYDDLLLSASQTHRCATTISRIVEDTKSQRSPHHRIPPIDISSRWYSIS